jgi:hypothetical protein
MREKTRAGGGEGSRKEREEEILYELSCDLTKVGGEGGSIKSEWGGRRLEGDALKGVRWTRPWTMGEAWEGRMAVEVGGRSRTRMKPASSPLLLS